MNKLPPVRRTLVGLGMGFLLVLFIRALLNYTSFEQALLSWIEQLKGNGSG